MADAAVLSLRPLYQLQLRTCATIAELALRGTADLIDAKLDAARQAIASNLEQCEALMTGNGTAAMQAFVPVDLVSSADTPSLWQRKWLDSISSRVPIPHRYGNASGSTRLRGRRWR